MISLHDVRISVQNQFGFSLSEDSEFEVKIFELLHSWFPGKENLASLRGRMEDLLFNLLYDRLGPGMALRLADGSCRRILMSDLPSAADAMLFPLFISFRISLIEYERLHSFWMEYGSFSAMRVLYLHFYDYLPDQERFLIERTVHENIPPVQQEEWFNRKDNSSR